MKQLDAACRALLGFPVEQLDFLRRAVRCFPVEQLDLELLPLKSHGWMAWTAAPFSRQASDPPSLEALGLTCAESLDQVRGSS